MGDNVSNDWSNQTVEVRLRHRRSFLQVLGGMPLSMLLTVLGMLSAGLSLLDGRYQTLLFACILVLLVLESRRIWRTEKRAIYRMARYAQMKGQLGHEVRLRHEFEAMLVDGKSRLQLLDEELAVMVLLVSSNGECRYHNRAFAKWINLRPGQINGKHVRSIMGETFFDDMAYAYRKVKDGHHVRCEYAHTLNDGRNYRLVIQHVPYRGADGKVQGVYMVLEDVTQDKKTSTYKQTLRMLSTLPKGTSPQNLFVDSLAEQLIGDKDASARIMGAIEKGEFRLFSQEIRSLQQDTASHHEILIRLLEEEEYMMAPGAFFPLAERYGLMTHLDRWVVQHVLELIATDKTGQSPSCVFFINISEATLLDRSFADFIGQMLEKYQVHGDRLCLEIPDADLAVDHQDVVNFVHRVQEHAVRIALCGFGRNRVRFDPMEDFMVDFLKIDGSIVLEILRDPLALAKITAIQHVATELGVLTIAEFVEQAEIITKLTELGINFAQGFGIAQPQPLLPEESESTEI